MPNSVHPNISHDGPRNTVVEIIGVLDDGDLEPTIIVDIDTLYAEPGYKITKLRMDSHEYHIDPGLVVEMLWQGDDPAHVLSMSGKGFSNVEKSGGRQNSAVNPTGNLLIATQGYKATDANKGRMTFAVTLELVKQFT